MPSTTQNPTLDPDTIDDILYLARTNSLPELRPLLSPLTHHPASLSILLPQITDPDTGNTPFHMAAANAHTEILTYLASLNPQVSNGSSDSRGINSVDTKNTAGNTPLHYAALNGHLDTVKLLVSLGASRASVNGAGRTALEEAVAGGRDEVAGYLGAVDDGEGKGQGMQLRQEEEDRVKVEQREEEEDMVGVGLGFHEEKGTNEEALSRKVGETGLGREGEADGEGSGKG